MALSDHTTFQQIETLYGLQRVMLKRLMRQNLKTGQLSGMAATRSAFSDRRAHINEFRKK